MKCIGFISEKVQGILLIYKWLDPSLKEYQSSISASLSSASLCMLTLFLSIANSFLLRATKIIYSL